MTRRNTNSDLTSSHYTRVAGTGEAITRGFGAIWSAKGAIGGASCLASQAWPDAHPNPWASPGSNQRRPPCFAFSP